MWTRTCWGPGSLPPSACLCSARAEAAEAEPGLDEPLRSSALWPWHRFPHGTGSRAPRPEPALNSSALLGKTPATTTLIPRSSPVTPAVRFADDYFFPRDSPRLRPPLSHTLSLLPSHHLGSPCQLLTGLISFVLAPSSAPCGVSSTGSHRGLLPHGCHAQASLRGICPLSALLLPCSPQTLSFCHTPASGSLHWLFPLPETTLSQTSTRPVPAKRHACDQVSPLSCP